MKPIAILQHENTQGPGVLGEYLQQQNIAFDVITPCLDAHTPVRAADYRGLVVLGSNHCANEQLRWIEQERCLLQDALAHDVPVLGHCFGAQMLARAMGARVMRNPCANIGWSRVWVTRPAQTLLQVPSEITLFNWHYDTFEIPQKATRSMFGAFCLNKGFFYGRNWAFQGHLEVTEHSVKAWCHEGHEELRHAHGPAAQHKAQILAELPQHMNALHETAINVYSTWAHQLDRPAFFSLGALSAQWPLTVPANAPAPTKSPAQATVTIAPTLLRLGGLPATDMPSHAVAALQYQAPLAEQTKVILARVVH